MLLAPTPRLGAVGLRVAGGRLGVGQLCCEAEAASGFQGTPPSSLEVTAVTASRSPSTWKAPRSSAGERDATSLVKWYQVAKKTWHRDQRERESASCWLAVGAGVWGGPHLSPGKMTSPEEAGRLCPHRCTLLLGHHAPSPKGLLFPHPSTEPCKARPLVAQAPEGLKTMRFSRSPGALSLGRPASWTSADPALPRRFTAHLYCQPLPSSQTHPNFSTEAGFPSQMLGVLGRSL